MAKTNQRTGRMSRTRAKAYSLSGYERQAIKNALAARSDAFFKCGYRHDADTLLRLAAQFDGDAVEVVIQAHKRRGAKRVK